MQTNKSHSHEYLSNTPTYMLYYTCFTTRAYFVIIIDTALLVSKLYRDYFMVSWLDSICDRIFYGSILFPLILIVLWFT